MSDRESRARKRTGERKPVVRSPSRSSTHSVQSLIKDFEDKFSSRESSPEIIMKKSGGVPGDEQRTSRDVEASASSETLVNVNSFDDSLTTLGDTTLSAINVSVVLGDFVNNTKNSLQDWINGSILFSGFDAPAMRKRLISKARADELMICILVGLVRGNNVERIPLTLRSVEVKKKLDAAIKKMRIVSKVAGDYTAVTLSRMIACFPEVVCDILNAKPIPMAVDYDVLTNLHHEYPPVSRHQVCACIIPDELSSVELGEAMAVIMVPYMMTSEVINVRNERWRKKSKIEKYTDSMTYLQNSYNSKILTAVQRKQKAVQLGVVVNSKLSSAWRATAVQAANWLLTNYGRSPTENLEE